MGATLITADLHLSSTPRDDYRHQTIAKLPLMAQKAGVTRTLLLGDLTELKDRHNDWLVNQVVDAVERFAQLGAVWIDQGNHDYYSDPDCPFFGFLRHIKNVRWIGVPQSHKFDDLGLCMFLPHTRNYKEEWRGLKLSGFNWIFAHNTFEGSKVGSGKQMDGIPLDIFPKDARVVAGDVHVPQKNGCVTYVGAPYTVDFGDDYKPRVLLIEGDKLHPMSMDDEPQKVLIESVGLAGLKAYRPRDRDIVKMRITISRDEADKWPAIREDARAWALERGCIVHAVLPVMKERLGKAIDYSLDAPKSDKELVQSFAKNRGLDPNTAKMGLRFL